MIGVNPKPDPYEATHTSPFSDTPSQTPFRNLKPKATRVSPFRGPWGSRPEKHVSLPVQHQHVHIQPWTIQVLSVNGWPNGTQAPAI